MPPDDSQPSQPWRVAVIGGGLTGLAAAHRVLELCRARNVPLTLTLFEAGSRLGGLIRTKRIGDYLVETGADSFITNKPWAVDLCRRVGLEDELIPTNEAHRRSQVLFRGRPAAVPEGFMLLAPAKIWPVLRSPIFSLRGKLRMGCEYLIPRGPADGDESLAAFVRRRFGQEALERLVQPLVGGIYTSDPEKLSLRATMPRFVEMERQHRSLIRGSRRRPAERDSRATAGSGARYGLFATLRLGMSQLLDTLAERVAAGAEVRLETRVEDLSADPLSVTFRPAAAPAPAETEAFDAVIVTVPAPRAGALLGRLDAELSRLLLDIEHASSAIVVSGHNLSDIRDPVDAFGLVIPAVERRQILAVSYASRKFPGRAPEGRVLLRTFVGGAMQPEMLARSDDEILEMVRSELASILGVTGPPDFEEVCRYMHAMPQYHVGHLDRVAHIEQRLAQLPGVEVAGNAFHGVGIPDCIHSGEHAAERVFAEQVHPAAESR